MDVALIVSLLSPFMPKLLELGGQAAANITDVVSEKVGEAAWEKAQQVWKKLRPKVEENPDLKVATEQLATKPDSTARQAVFQEELETVLTENPDLAAAIAQILQTDASNRIPSAQIIQTVTGNQNQIIGQMTGGKVFGTVQGNVTIDE
ncbi:hypothetical protein ACQ4M4_26080 [Leptolyngbya sp. AN02str]|uniref:hypothetical protein n=1 Tax=Leptolyngbya sp. AN02str TaxID=3423363 RepID=UPI003D316976